MDLIVQSKAFFVAVLLSLALCEGTLLLAVHECPLEKLTLEAIRNSLKLINKYDDRSFANLFKGSGLSWKKWKVYWEGLNEPLQDQPFIDAASKLPISKLQPSRDLTPEEYLAIRWYQSELQGGYEVVKAYYTQRKQSSGQWETIEQYLDRVGSKRFTKEEVLKHWKVFHSAFEALPNEPGIVFHGQKGSEDHLRELERLQKAGEPWVVHRPISTSLDPEIALRRNSPDDNVPNVTSFFDGPTKTKTYTTVVDPKQIQFTYVIAQQTGRKVFNLRKPKGLPPATFAESLFESADKVQQAVEVEVLLPPGEKKFHVLGVEKKWRRLNQPFRSMGSDKNERDWLYVVVYLTEALPSN